ESVRCTPNGISVQWLDVYPGTLAANPAPVLEFSGTSGTRGSIPARDGDPTVEVRARGPRGSRGYAWRADWIPARLEPGRSRVVLLPRRDLPSLEASITCR